jgi:hypothetical protein
MMNYWPWRPPIGNSSDTLGNRDPIVTASGPSENQFCQEALISYVRRERGRLCFAARPEAEAHSPITETAGRLIHEVDGALTVSLKVNDEAQEDLFQRSNITGLVITPEGEFHGYNVKLSSHFVRAGS